MPQISLLEAAAVIAPTTVSAAQSPSPPHEQANASITAGSRLAYDALIDPRDLRNALLAGLSLHLGAD